MKKTISFILTIIMMITSFGGFALGADEGTGSKTEFSLCDTNTKNGAIKSVVEMLPGDTCSLQLNFTAAIKSFSMVMTQNAKDDVIELSLYKWNRNISATRSEKPIVSKKFDSWKRKDVIVFDVGTGHENPGPGEYLLSLTLVEGDEFSLNWYKPAITGVCGYFGNYVEYGAFPVSVMTVEPQTDIFTRVSKEEGKPEPVVPKEPEIAKDSAIAMTGADSTQWNYVDGLGRSAVNYYDAGNKNDKKVGIFYWTWHYGFSQTNKAFNVTNILKEYPDAKNDYNHIAWNPSKTAGAFFWNEPIWGYYTETDEYVLRKQAELLADAGVDFVAFDCTNADYLFEESFMALLKVWDEARKDGVNTPKISFMLGFAGSSNTFAQLKKLYRMLYCKGLYRDLWFYWDGKPLIIAYESVLSENNEEEKDIKNFFTFKHGDAAYMTKEASNSSWGWLSCYPQAVYKNPDGSVEQITVGCAQNANYEWCYDENGNKSGENPCSAMNGPKNMGRSYVYNKNFKYTYKYCGKEIIVDSAIENSKLYGLNFQEQWDYAISVDPEIIFVTGWNEWIAGRNEKWGGVENGFPDQCDDENSRDCEPSKGDLKDYYYYQLVANIRRFKGMSVPVSQTDPKTIDINGDVSQWNDDSIISYGTYTHNTYERDVSSWSKTGVYNNAATRNDFVCAKASYDDDNIYFYVKTLDDITPYTDENWMRLLIDTVSSEVSDNGWEGFEFIINRSGATGTDLTIERFDGGWKFEKIGNVPYKVTGNIMQLSVPREMLGLKDKEVKFSFKWCDDNLQDGDIFSLYTLGDAAPGERFAFMFSSVATKPIKEGTGHIVWWIIIAVAAVVLVAGIVTILALSKKKKIAKMGTGHD